jgi:hypothetical protein
VTVFYGFAADVAFPYGPDGGYVNATAHSVKFNIDAAGWPFCSAAGQLMVDLTMHTSAGEQDEALLFDDAGGPGSRGCAFIGLGGGHGRPQSPLVGGRL